MQFPYGEIHNLFDAQDLYNKLNDLLDDAVLCERQMMKPYSERIGLAKEEPPLSNQERFMGKQKDYKWKTINLWHTKSKESLKYYLAEPV